MTGWGVAALTAGWLACLPVPVPVTSLLAVAASAPSWSAPTRPPASPPRLAAAPVATVRLAGPAARVFCTISDRRITESSGLVAAGDSLYTVNDGGDRLRVFVLDRGCRVRRVIENPLNPYDVEDLARSPDGTLWLADIGDNDAARRTVAVELLTDSGEASLFRFSYPDGAHDAEALLLDRHGRPYLVTKEPLGARVYTPARTPAADRSTPLRLVVRLPFPPTGTPGGPVGAVSQVLVTGGAVAAGGTRLVLRTYTDAYLWSAPDGDLAAALRSGRPDRIALPATAQGEAIAFSADGRTLLTSTEGLPAAVHAVPLDDADGAASGSPGPTQPGPTQPGPTPTGRSGSAAADPAADGGGSSLGRAAVAALLAGALIWVGGRLRGALCR